ncbi:hypothetical protein WJX84_000741 [Apatococcus fuscideae]|uniref:Uncharacterized protein n=1 Tax=Apatococcus fuscideae TaxID=2026836 RepID=A0AAW1SZG3_9CHLO
MGRHEPEWTVDFSTFKICEESTISPLETGNGPEFFPLSCVDKSAAFIFTAFEVILPFPRSVPDSARLHASLRKLATKYPVLAARVVTRGGSQGFACLGQGFPLSIASWPSGHSGIWPKAASFERWTGSLPEFSPPPPFAAGIQATEVVKGSEPLLKIRLTKMGDGSSVLSASVAHVLMDAGRATEMMAHLATIYRGEEAPAAAPDSKAKQVRAEAMFKPFVLRPPCLKNGPRPRDTVARALPGPNGYSWHALHIPSGQLRSLKESINAESQAFGIPFVSTADITSSIVWLLRCKAYDLPLPTEGGSIILTAADIGRAGLPKGTVPDNYIGNAVASIPVIAPAVTDFTNTRQFTCHSDEEAFTRALLESTCAVRRAVLAFRKDPSRAVMNAIYLNNLPSKLRPISMARLAKTYKYPIVALLTERTSFKTDEVDFGHGPPTHNLGLPTWPVNLPAVVSKCPTGVIVQIMMDMPESCLSPIKPLLDAIAPQASWVG